MAENYNFTSQGLGGAVTWNTSVSAVTGYRSDLASGITAARVPYSAVAATATFSKDLSSINTSTIITAITARTVAQS